MQGQSRQLTSRILWRRRWLILAVVLGISGVTYAVSTTRPPVYAATATLVVNQPSAGAASFDTVQANQAFARTLARLIGSRNVAALVVPRLDFPLSAVQAQDRLSFAPVTETQLVEVTAQDRDPRRAQELANIWASTFIDYVRIQLPEAAPSGLSVADPASLPLSPTRPRPLLYTLVALVLSAAAAVALVLVRSRYDDRVLDADDLVAEFGRPVLGTLPTFGRSDRSQLRFEESVRLLATALQFASDRPLRSVSFTSVSGGEGKSTVTWEVAWALATLSLEESSVLAVDADLRRPSLHRQAGLPAFSNEIRGLSHYLRRQAEVADCLIETDLPSLRLMPTGPLPQNASTLLGIAASRDALARLRDRAEVVVIDTPPLLSGADASMVASVADAVVVVVDLRRARWPELRRGLEQLDRVGATLLGFVVNRAAVGDASSAAAYAPLPPDSDDEARADQEGEHPAPRRLPEARPEPRERAG